MSANSGARGIAHRFLAEDGSAVAAQRAAVDELSCDGEPASELQGLAPTIAGPMVRGNSSHAGPRRFGDYELLEEIARGGMGVVFKARDMKIRRVVALKMILAGELASCDDVLRFHIEVEAAAQLNHPNIVPVYEAGQVDERHYFTMRLIEGESLAALIAAGPLEPCRAARLLDTIAQAVQHAHDHGVIHRDLKPDNILLDADGRPYITDFGVARQMGEQGHLTGVGQVLGTPNYMSPEQATGEAGSVGPASDVFSLGAVLYTMLTGRPPFEGHRGDVPAQVLLQEPVAPRRLNLRIPSDLETICLKCLAKESHQRYASAAELAAELDRFLAHEPILARPARVATRAAKWTERQPAVAAAAVLTVSAMILGLGGFAWQWRRAENAERLYAPYDLRDQAQAIDFSPDGRLLAMGRPNGAVVLYQTADGAPVASLSPGFVPYSMRFAPQGSILAASGERLVKVLDYESGCELRIFKHPDAVRAVAWSPDGALLATACADGRLYLWNCRTGAQLHRFENHQNGAIRVVFSGQGKLLASHHRNHRTPIGDVR